MFIGELLADMVGGGKTRVAAPDNDDLSIVAASQGFVDFLVLKIDRLEPEVIDVILVEIRRPEIPPLVVGSGKVFHFYTLRVTVTCVKISRCSSSLKNGTGSRQASGGYTPGGTRPWDSHIATTAGAKPVGNDPLQVRVPIR